MWWHNLSSLGAAQKKRAAAGASEVALARLGVAGPGWLRASRCAQRVRQFIAPRL